MDGLVERAVRAGATAETFKQQRRLFEDVAGEWLAPRVSRVKDRQVRTDRQMVENSLVPLFGGREMRAITATQINAYVTKLAQQPREVKDRVVEGLAPQTIRNRFNVLSPILDYAVVLGALPANPAKSVRLPTAASMNRRAKQRVYLTAGEVVALSEAVGLYPFNLLVRSMAYTGLRVGEVAGLNMSDVRLGGRPQLNVRQQRVRHPGGGWDTTATKNTGSAATVEIYNHTLVEDLRRYVAQHPHSGDPDAPFWPGTRGVPVKGMKRGGWSSEVSYDVPWDAAIFLRKRLRPAAEAVGINPEVVNHALRHTCASLHAPLLTMQELSQLMRHARVSTTMDLYAHLYPDSDEERNRKAAAITAAFNVSAPGVSTVTRLFGEGSG